MNDIERFCTQGFSEGLLNNFIYENITFRTNDRGIGYLYPKLYHV